jgi:hypothetical protein
VEEAVLSLHYLLDGGGVLLEVDYHINHILASCFGSILEQRRSVVVFFHELVSLRTLGLVQKLSTSQVLMMNH